MTIGTLPILKLFSCNLVELFQRQRPLLLSEASLDDVEAAPRDGVMALRGRGDVQQYRVELPGPKVTKDIAADSKVRIEVPRSHFNELATKGHIGDWREAFEKGDAQATGIEQVMKLIVNVVERQEERARTRKAKH